MILKKTLFSILAFLSAIILLEIGAMTLEKTMTQTAIGTDDRPGWQADFFSHRMDFHEPDPQLLWRHRANLDYSLIQTNSEGLLGGEISRSKEETEFRILLLGDSSPVGLGLMRRNEAFGEQLRYLLNQYFGGTRKAELLNAAVSGYTSEQLRRFFECRGRSLKPDLVMVYCGNNDASISGKFTDRELLENQTVAGLRGWCGKLAIYRILRSALGKDAGIVPADMQSLTVRVPSDRYYENLKAISDICHDNHWPVIFMKPPVARLWPAGLQFKIFRHITGDNGQTIFPEILAGILGREIKYCLDIETLNLLDGELDPYKKAVYESSFNHGENDIDSIEHYRIELNNEPDTPILINNLGVSFWEAGQFDSADVYLHDARGAWCQSAGDSAGPATIAAGSPFLFNMAVNYISRGDTGMADIMLDSALQADYFSLRIKKEYWQAIDSLNGLEDVFVIDLPDIFGRNGGDRLFVDHCHPTREGHRLIARTLFDSIRDNSMIK